MKIDTSAEFVYLNQHVSTFYTGVSSVLGSVKEFILDFFPSEYFKKITVETASQASLMDNTLQDGLVKMSYPFMNIGVNIPTEYDEKTMRPLMQRAEMFIQPNIRQNYPRILVDPDDNYTIGFSFEWVPLSYDFRMTTNTFMNSIDLMNWIRTKLPLGFSGYIKDAPLEFELPQSIVKTIAELQGYNLNTKEGVAKLDRYLLSVGRTLSLIKRKVSATTGQQSYFMTIDSDIQVNIEGLEAPTSIIRTGLSESEYVVTFSVRANAYFPVSYLMKVRRDYLVSRVTRQSLEEIYNTPDQPLVDGLMSLAVDVDAYGKRDTINYKTSNGQDVIGHLMYEWTFVYGSEEFHNPVVNMFDLIDDPELKRVHSFAVQHGIDLENLFHFEGYKVAYSQGDIDFEMDYENFQINIENAEFSEVLIRFYLNRAAYESIQESMKNDTFYFNKNVITYVEFLLWDKETNKNIKKRARVLFFKDKKEMYDENPLKTLKILTKYGFGYIEIKPFDEKDVDRDDDIGLIVIGYKKKLKKGKPVPIIYEIVFAE